MAKIIDEAKRNLRAVGQFDLADALESVNPYARESEILEFTRYLVALDGCRFRYATKTRADIIATLWGYVDKFPLGDHLRVMVLICIEQLIRECPDIESIRGELRVLSAVYAVSFGRSYDLQELANLVGQRNFDELRRLLPPPDTNAVIYVFGKAYKYHKYGTMSGYAYNEALEEAKLWPPTCNVAG